MKITISIDIKDTVKTSNSETVSDDINTLEKLFELIKKKIK